MLDDAGVAACPVAGWSIGVNTMFELAVTHPERVAGLFAVAGVPGETFGSMGAPLFIPASAQADRDHRRMVAAAWRQAGPPGDQRAASGRSPVSW